ncbi:type VII secretion protein EccE [Micromonospora sp. LOL_024]|uniref:type VII secretion protein EccE n=1 Tax=Micromonospora sp. LOL_024 TaxID=3345412 RepID=UPI003A8C739E
MATTGTPARPAPIRLPPPGGPSPTPGRRIPPSAAQWRRGQRWRSGTGQIVMTQVTLAGFVAALGRGPLPTLAATVATATLLALTWCRVRQRWLHEWLAVGLSHLARRRAATPASGPAALLGLAAPSSVIRPVELAGAPAAVLDDPAGLVALLEIGDPADLLGDGAYPLPSPAQLLPADAGESPPVRLQLLLAGAAAPAPASDAGLAAASYRQLTGGRLASWERAVLVVRVSRARGWPEEVLLRTLAGTVHRIIRRLRPLAVRPLGERPTLRVFAEFAHHDGRGVRESWQAVRSGGMLQTAFRLSRWPTADAASQLVPRLLGLPATATTVSLDVGTDPPADTGLTVRLGAVSAAELSAAAQALRRTVAAVGGAVQRLDGEHLAGLARTLPLALAGTPPVLPGGADLDLPYGSAGLMLGVNRHDRPVTVRLFRPEGTRVMLVGGVRAAQLLTLRAMALGARVVVRTARPHAWESFVRGAVVPGDTIPLLPPGRPLPGHPATPLTPMLVVQDAPSPPAGPRPGTAWQATLLVRDELTPADADASGRADLAVFQPLSPSEATVAGTCMGLGDSAQMLTRIRPDMVAVVNRRALRWALLAATPIEAQLVGPLTRGQCE